MNLTGMKNRLTLSIVGLWLSVYIIDSIFSNIALELVIQMGWSEGWTNFGLLALLVLFDLIIVLLLLNSKILSTTSNNNLPAGIGKRYWLGLYFLCSIFGLYHVYLRLNGIEHFPDLDLTYYSAQFSFILFAPLEELLYRKIFLSNLLKDNSISTAIIINSTMFTLAHIRIDFFDMSFLSAGLPVLYYVTIFVFSACVDFVYVRTRNIFNAIAFHLFYSLVLALFALKLIL